MRITSLLALPSLWLPVALLADEATQRGPVRFTGPEILKLDWNTRAPRVGDFNQDGLPDIALINQDRSRIEILLQSAKGAQPSTPEVQSRTEIWNPILEMSRFTKQPLVVGKGMYSLVTGDWSGDQRTDLAYTTDDNKLVLRTQGAEVGDWTQKREFMLDSVSDDADSLLAVDLNGDKRTDLALLTETRLQIYLQEGEGSWKEPVSHALTAKGCSMLGAADLNGDGRLDLYCTPGDADAVLVRLQTETGGFGEEWRLELPQSRSWVKAVRLGKGHALAWIQEATGMVELAQITTAPSSNELDHSASIRHAIPPSDSRAGATAYGDVTGDGAGDVIIAEPKAARVWVFAGRKDHTFEEGREYPSLSGVEAMLVADADGDGKTELLVLSPTEKTIAIARWSGGRLGYPEMVHQSEDSLVGLAVGRLHEKKETVIASVRDGKPKPQLLTLSWKPADKKYVSQLTDLPSPPSKLSGLTLLDADQDGRGDVVLFSTLSPMQILVSRADPKAPLKKVEGLPDSLTTKLPVSALSQGDLNADGKPEIVIARDALARVIQVDAEARAKVVEQFNAPGSGGQVSAAILVGAKAVSDRRVLLIESSQRQLHELRPDQDGVFRPRSVKALGNAALDDARVLAGADSTKLLLLGRQSFEVLPLTGPTLALQRLASFSTELKDTTPIDIVAAPFGGSGVDDLMLIDSKKTRVAEFFRSNSEGHKSWRSYMYFRVFQSDPHYRGKTGYEYEPHGYTSMDINGDGRADLCLLAHDRLLLYVQE
jgi:hypothetical protein